VLTGGHSSLLRQYTLGGWKHSSTHGTAQQYRVTHSGTVWYHCRYDVAVAAPKLGTLIDTYKARLS
jgi:hypothetical protein